MPLLYPGAMAGTTTWSWDSFPLALQSSHGRCFSDIQRPSAQCHVFARSKSVFFKHEHAREDLIKAETDSVGLRWGLGATIPNKPSGDVGAGQRATPSSRLESKKPPLCSHEPCGLQHVPGFSDLDALLSEAALMTLVRSSVELET